MTPPRSSRPTSAATAVLLYVVAGCGGTSSSNDSSATGADSNADEGSSTPLTTGISGDGDTGVSTTANSTTGSADTSGEETSNGFIGMPDGGVEGMCDVWSQDCPEGEKCTPALIDNMVQPTCVSVDPNPGQVGDPCTRNDATGEDSCDIGVLCVPDPNPELMRCFALCGGSPADPVCPGEKDVCVIADGGATPICFPTCDPLLQDCNIVGWGCFPGNGGYICAPDQSGGANHQGDPCGGSLNTCAAGLLCSGGVAGCANTCCTPYCDLGAADPSSVCPGVAMGEECVAVYADPQPEFENVGVCLLPE